jgi:nucleotide-binding universal stress UspA family protein
MFSKVIVGVGDAPHAHDAIRLARALAPQAELHLVHAYPLDPGSWSGADSWRRGLRTEAERLLADLAAEAGVAAQGKALPDLSPARALHLVAEDLHADLIVMGSARHGVIGRLLAGSTVRSTLAGAPCPVAVAPGGYAGGRPERIGVAYDGSPEARHALEVAAAIARDTGARLRIAHVVSPPVEIVAPMYPFAYGNHDWARHGEVEISQARSEVERVVADLGPDVEAEGEVLFGHSRKELAGLTEFLDLLVTGSRGWGPARQVLLGGTSNHLVHNAVCPVLVVPRGAGHPDEHAGEAVETASA